MSNVFHLVSKYGLCFMDPILSLGKESLKRLCFVGDEGKVTPSSHGGTGIHQPGTRRFQYRLAPVVPIGLL